MLKFKHNKEKSDWGFKVYECEEWDYRIIIMEWKTISVYVKRTIYNEKHSYLGFIELWDHRPTSLLEAKHVAERLLDIALWYKPVEIWKEY